MKNKVLNYTVDDTKIRLDKYLAEYSDMSRSRVQRDIEIGNVKVNKKVILLPKYVVRLKDIIEYSVASELKTTYKPVPLKTLYNNHGLLIIDKAAGIAVHPGAGLKGDSLADALLYYFKDIYLVGEEGRAGIVHRLDKDTSGVMLVALTQEMYEYLKDAFAQRKIKKEYIALVIGNVEKQHGMIDTPMGKSKTDFRKYTTKGMLQSKSALTEYWVLERLDGYTLVRVRLHTGRTHQIRVHFLSIGHPLAGDSLYGTSLGVKIGSKTSQASKSSKQFSLPGLGRQFLHAKQIEVQLPDGTWIEAESDLPDDLRKVLRNLNSKYANR